MRSRSYSAIVLSSLLLTAISCFAQQAPASEDWEGRDSGYHKEEPKEEANGDLPEATEDGGGGEDSGFDEAGGLDGGAALPEGDQDVCLKGSMVFEGRCISKTEVERLLEHREQQALKRVQQAKMPHDVADAAHDLLEKQIAQVDKAEDDLDEIIAELKKENRERAAKAAKADDGPVPEEEQP